MGRSHEVVLLGKKFKLRSNHDEAHLAELAAYVTSAVTEAQRRGTVSTLDAALLAALNIADELFQVRRDAEDRLAAIGDKTQALLAALEEDGSAQGAADVSAEAEADGDADADSDSERESAELAAESPADPGAPARADAARR